MAAPGFALGFLELIVLLSGGGSLSGAGLLGLPPGPRDPKLIACAPADAAYYIEWAERSSGKEGAPGIDGLAADPEIRLFLQQIDAAFQKSFDADSDAGVPFPPQLLYPLAKLALTRPGCAFVSLDVEAMRQLTDKGGISPATWASYFGTAVRGAIVVNAGTKADEVEGQILDLMENLSDGGRPENLKMREMPGSTTVPLIVHRQDNYLILALGKPAAESAAAGLTGKLGKSEGLTKHAAFAAGLRKTAIERPGCVTWFDLAGTIDRLSEGLGPQGVIVKTMSTTIGLDAVKSITTTSGLTNGDLHQRTHIATNGKTQGLLALAGGRGLTAADVAHIPADADLSYAVSFNLPKVFAALKGVATKADPGSVAAINRAVEQLETDLGLSLENDLFASLGDVWTLHDSPDAGGLLVSSLVLNVEVKDRKKTEAVVAKLLTLLDQALREEAGGDGSLLDEHEFLGHTVTTLDLPDHAPPFQPTFCLTDRHLIAALHPQAVKAHLRHLAAKSPGLDTRWGKPLLSPEGDSIVSSFVDTRALVRLLSVAVPYWGKPISRQLKNQHDIEFPQFSIPSAAAYLPFVSPAVSAVSRTDDGIALESRGGLPLPGGLGSLVAFSVAALRPAHHIEQIREGRVNDQPAPAAKPVQIQLAPARVIRVQAVPVRAVPIRRAVPIQVEK